MLRQLSDFKGDELVSRVLAVIDERKPLHVSLVGGDPLVRYRELETLLPEMERRGVHTQIVTSAFRVIPGHWKQFLKLNVVVSIDGLQPEHDVRRKPATYERILKNIRDAHVTIHCTVTAQIAKREGYLEEFLAFWSQQPQIAKVWFSLFTPQLGAKDPEILSAQQRVSVIAQLRVLRRKYAVLDMPDAVIDEIEILRKVRKSASLQGQQRRFLPISRPRSHRASSEVSLTVVSADASPRWDWQR